MEPRNSRLSKLPLKPYGADTIDFIVLNAQAGGSYVGSTPIVVQNMGGGMAMATGGHPMIAPNQGLVIKMFKDGNPQGTNALPARYTLGPDWQEQIKRDSINCL